MSKQRLRTCSTVQRKLSKFLWISIEMSIIKKNNRVEDAHVRGVPVEMCN